MNRPSGGVPSIAVVSGLTEESAQNIWQALRKAIREIQEGNASKLRFEELYRNAYTLVLHKHGDLLYRGVEAAVTEKLQSLSEAVLAATQDTLLEVLVSTWEHHKLIMSMMKDILMYLDNAYCGRHGRLPVYQLGLALFLRVILRNGQVMARLRDMLLSTIRAERQGEVIDRMLVKNSLAMLAAVDVEREGVYERDFEEEFLRQTSAFFETESQAFMSVNTVPDYLRKVERRLREEEERAAAYLQPGTRPKLMRVLHDKLIRHFAPELVANDSSGCVSLFAKDAVDDLHRMYVLFRRVEDTAPLALVRRCMADVVKETGQAIVKGQADLKDPTVFVQQVLDCKDKFARIVTSAFERDRDFALALKDALEFFINIDSRAAMYLSLFVDKMLKSGLKGVSEQDVDRRLNSVVAILRYLHDKDVFEEFYKQHLAQRLLSGSSGSRDVENAMIGKLKTECGHQFTSRLEGMFRDMQVSAQTMDGFRAGAQHVAPAAVEHLHVTVLTTGFWPMAHVKPCRLPDVAEDARKAFEKYYQEAYSGRRLVWCPHLGTSELRCVFDKGRKELVVHTYQMCILMLFNQRDIYTFKQIEELTAIPREELKRHLLSLAHPKVRVLRKNPNTNHVEDDHRFKYNMGYQSKLFRVKIKLLAARHRDEKKEGDVDKSVQEARKIRVEASIVRVMKSRKKLDHVNLVTEVMKQLTSKFRVEPAFIKKRIESLIDREYLERDANDRRLYRYLA